MCFGQHCLLVISVGCEGVWSLFSRELSVSMANDVLQDNL